MAATRKRASLRARATSSAKTSNSASNRVLADQTTSTASNDQSWPLTKKDKRTVKHNHLINRVRDANITKHPATKKRRRPAKKLRAAEQLGEMKDALDEIGGSEDDDWEGFSDSDADMEIQGSRTKPKNGRMVMRSLKHRPGAMKRKAKMDAAERGRFERNLAQLSQQPVGSGNVGSQSVAHAEKWAALRKFITGTMQQDKAFAVG